MGNNNSKSAGSAPQSANASPHFTTNDPVPTRRAPKRRESIQVLPSSKTTAAAPAPSLEIATGESTSQSRASASHSRGRSQTAANSTQKSQAASKEMGNRPSTEKASGLKDSSTPNRSQSPARRSLPLTTPISTDVSNERPVPSPGATSSPSPTPYSLPPSQFIRPPRLPLPIEEELLSPGSPIISPADLNAGDNVDVDGSLPRKTSILSSTTMDEEEVGDEMFRAVDLALGMPAIDTLIEWKQGGKKVYVTGTFANWNKKFKLHENGPSKDPKALSALIPLPPGTHHVTFLVDGQMRTASHMPTAVDWTNALVNYIEVSASDQGKPSIAKDSQQQQATSQAPAPSRQGVGGTQHAMPQTPELRATGSVATVPAPNSSAPARSSSKKQQAAAAAAPSTTKKQPVDKKYHPEIPRFLLDLDAPEESSRYLRASAVMATQPPPPSLPMFLSKSILNGATPMKDDSSVLVLPNHTVLNHLATSSIKNGVLATSATTRYKKKYVTTILYKPTSEVGD